MCVLQASFCASLSSFEKRVAHSLVAREDVIYLSSMNCGQLV